MKSYLLLTVLTLLFSLNTFALNLSIPFVALGASLGCGQCAYTDQAKVRISGSIYSLRDICCYDEYSECEFSIKAEFYPNDSYYYSESVTFHMRRFDIDYQNSRFIMKKTLNDLYSYHYIDDLKLIVKRANITYEFQGVILDSDYSMSGGRDENGCYTRNYRDFFVADFYPLFSL